MINNANLNSSAFDIFLNGPDPINLRSVFNEAGSPKNLNIRFIVQSDIGTTDNTAYALDTGDWSDMPGINEEGYQNLFLIVPSGKYVAGAQGKGQFGNNFPCNGPTDGYVAGTAGGDAILVRRNLIIALGSEKGGIAKYNAINWSNPAAGEYGHGVIMGGGGGGAGVYAYCGVNNSGCVPGNNGAGWNGYKAVKATTGGSMTCKTGMHSVQIPYCDGGEAGQQAPDCGQNIPRALGAPSGPLGIKTITPYTYIFT